MSAYLFILLIVIVPITTAGWSEWFGSRIVNATDELITLKSENNATITKICATFEKSPYFYTSISAYFSDNYASLAGDPFDIRRLCTDAVNEGECVTSVYVTYDTTAVEGLQLMTSDDVLFGFLGSFLGSNSNIYWKGYNAEIASGMLHECLTGIAVYWTSSAISRIRFRFSENGYLEDVVSDQSAFSVSKQTTTTQISTTQRTSATTKQQAVVINIDRESSDSLQTSNILLIMIVIVISICLMIMVYKMWGDRCQEFIGKHDGEKSGNEEKHEALHVVDLEVENEGNKKRNDGLEYTSVQVLNPSDHEAQNEL